jgi:hypothetical protein
MGSIAVKDGAAIALSELRRACRDSSAHVQLAAHGALFELLDAFVATEHPAAPLIFKSLGFSLIEQHADLALRAPLARFLEHSLGQHAHAALIPVGVLLKPFLKQVSPGLKPSPSPSLSSSR